MLDSPFRPLRIAVLAHIRHPIRQPFRGGMESHAWYLTKGLMARGHDVTLFASGDSDPALPVRPVLPVHYERDMPWARWRGTQRFARLQDERFRHAALLMADGDFDVVHNNCLHPLPLDWAGQSGHPMVTSLHVPPFKTLREAVERNARPWMLHTVTSEVQMRTWWDRAPPRARVASNGIDTGAWPFREKGDGSLAWVGRISPTKGTADAIRAARLAGRPLAIYGPIDESDYFHDTVEPLLGGDVAYRGHLASRALARAIGSASALLFTPLWNEPFGLTAIEAMACGVPVAAYDNGAAREVIGPCGTYAGPGDVAGLAGAVEEAVRLPRAAARRRVERLFSLDSMIDRYEACYRAAIGGRSARARAAAGGLLPPSAPHAEEVPRGVYTAEPGR